MSVFLKSLRIQKCCWPNKVQNGRCWLCVTPPVTEEDVGGGVSGEQQ